MTEYEKQKEWIRDKFRETMQTECERKDKRIADLEKQMEKMKCCENCKYKDCNKTSQYQTCWYCKNKDKWKLKE